VPGTRIVESAVAEVAGDLDEASVLGFSPVAMLLSPSEHAFDEFAAGLRLA
jgi:hypothetical protein